MAVDFFLKIDGIKGESADAKHKDEIQIQTWGFGESQTGTSAHGTGMGAGKVHMQDFHFTMPTNSASPKLFLACATGEHIKSALLTCRKAGGEQQEYLKWSFTELLISSYQTGGHTAGTELPSDQISFNFTKVEVEYHAQDAKGGLGGAIKAGYDVKANKKV